MLSSAWVLGIALFSSSPTPWQEPLDGRRSRIRLAGAEIVASILGDSPPTLPPDLSRPGTTPVPGTAVLSTPTTTLWDDRILPPGEYELSVIVDEQQDVFLDAAAADGVRHRLPVELADYSRPASTVEMLLAGEEPEDANEVARGHLLLRWGSLLFQGNFTLLRRKVWEGNGWTLVGYEHPAGMPFRSQLPIGLLESRGGEAPERYLTLIQDPDGPSRLRFEKVKFRHELSRRMGLRHQLAEARRLQRTRREDSTLDARVERLESSLEEAERRLRALEGNAVVEVTEQSDTTPLPSPSSADATLRFTFEVQGDRPGIVIARGARRTFFPLP